MNARRIISIFLCLTLLFALYPAAAPAETVPAAPQITSPANGIFTMNNKPTYMGTSDPASTVSIKVNEADVGSATADASGNWSITHSSSLSDGSYTVYAVASDGAGHTSSPSNAITFTVDTTAPAAPEVITPEHGSATNDDTPDITGTAEAGSTITIYVDSSAVGTTAASLLGGWSFTLTAALSDGDHTVEATAKDAAGNVSFFSDSYQFTVDTLPPGAPSVITPEDGSRTADNTPAISGQAGNNDAVTVIVDGAAVETVTPDGQGNWSFTPASALADGSHTVKAIATDMAGNISVDSNTNTFTVDATPPDAPVVITPANGSSTRFSTPALSGTAESNSTVTVIVDGSVLGTTTAGGSGNWSFAQPFPLPEGSHTVRAAAADAVGNTSVDSNTNNFTVDITPPAAPVVSTPANGSGTNDNTPAYLGTAEANSTVTVYTDGTAQGTTTADGAGNWSFTQLTPLADGPHSVKATTADAAGNTSIDSNTSSFTVDTTPPAPPVVNSPPNGYSTNYSTPSYLGTAVAGNAVKIYVDGAVVGTVTANENGIWFLIQPTPLADGSHTVKATTADAFGNTSLDSNVNTFTVDIIPPAKPSAMILSGSVSYTPWPQFYGTAEMNSTVTIYVDNDDVGTTIARETWSFTIPTPLSDGVHTMYVTARDAAGNYSSYSNIITFTVDTVPPAAPVITAPASGSTTNDSTPDITGTAEALCTILLYMNGGYAGTVTADGSGNWSFTPASPLKDANHTVKAKARDAAGWDSVFSTECAFTVDTSLPVSIAAIMGVTPPVKGAAPVTHITETNEYTGIVAWLPDDAVFKPGTVYTATVTLSAKAGFRFRDITANFFTVNGAAATNEAGAGVVKAVFPATAAFVNAQLSPAAFTHNLYAPVSAAAQIIFNDAQSVTGVVLGSKSLSSPADYTVSGNTLTVEKSFLAGLGLKKDDSLSFRVLFNAGAEAVLSMTVVNSAPAMYNVTFYNRDEAYTVKTVQAGLSLGSALWPANPRWSGRTFGGWYTGQNGTGSAFTANTAVNGAVNVYAKWSASAPDLSHEGGEQTPQPQVLLNGGTTNMVTLNPDPSGSGVQILTVGAGGSALIMQPGFQLSVMSFSQPPAAPVFMPPPVVQSLFGSVLTNMPAPPASGQLGFSDFAAMTFPGGLISGAGGGLGTLTYQTDIGSASMPSNLLSPGGTQGIPAGADATLTILSGGIGAGPGSLIAPSGYLQVTNFGLSMGNVPVLQSDPAAQVLMSIPYTLTGPAVINPQNLIVMHIDENGATSVIPGSQYNRVTGTMDFSTTLFGCFVIIYQP